jgi:hypothetical protein
MTAATSSAVGASARSACSKRAVEIARAATKANDAVTPIATISKKMLMLSMLTPRWSGFTPNTRSCRRDQHDLAVRVPLLELGERVADPFEWIRRGNRNLDLS